MPISAIDNTRQVYSTVEDHRTGQDSLGADLPYPKTIERWRANADVDKGEAVMWVAPTETVPLSVTPMTTAAGPQLFVGVALHDALEGNDVDICVQGVCHVLLEDADAGGAFSNVLTEPDTTTGRLASAAAGALLGVLGVQLGPEIGTTNVALCKIGFVGRADDDGA